MGKNHLSLSRCGLVFAILIYSLAGSSLYGQEIKPGPYDREGIIYGFGIRLEFDYGRVARVPSSLSAGQYGDRINKNAQADHQAGFSLSASMGIGYNYFGIAKSTDDLRFSPLFHLGFRLSQGRGQLGNSGSYNQKKDTQFEFINSFHFILGYEGMVSPKEFQYFTSNHANSLFVSQEYYLSLGTILIHSPNREFQRSGSIGISAKEFSLFYTNDGGPVHHELLLGDKWDRYWNGGLAIYAGNLETYQDFGRLVFSFDRFTGYHQNSYRYSGQMKFDYVSYGKEDQINYNKGVWKLRYSDFNRGVGGFIALHDIKKIDLQHWLHLKGNMSYHPNFLNWSLHLGGSLSN